MIPHRVIGFRATASSGYDCSFMVIFPMHVGVSSANINAVCQHAVNEANRLHGGIKIIGQIERIIMG